MGILSASTDDIVKAIIGGLLISIATTLNLALKGQITGMSGTLKGIITYDKPSMPTKISLLVGMISTSSIFYLSSNEGQFFETVQQFQSGLNIPGFIIAGYLTGLGASLQNGCTSGHGVCGLPRFSLRSYVAVGVFMISAISTANIVYQSLPEYDSNMVQAFQSERDIANNIETSIILGIGILTSIIYIIRFKKQISDCLTGTLVGVTFAAGLIISGMVKRHVILGFLVFNKNWNPSLLFVLGFAVIPNIFTFYYIRNKTKKPLLSDKFCIPQSKQIDIKLILGAVLFGIGWGLGGLCPGPVFCLIPTFYLEIIVIFTPSLIVGLLTPSLYEKIINKKNKNIIQLEKNSQQSNSLFLKIHSDTSPQIKENIIYQNKLENQQNEIEEISGKNFSPNTIEPIQFSVEKNNE